MRQLLLLFLLALAPLPACQTSRVETAVVTGKTVTTDDGLYQIAWSAVDPLPRSGGKIDLYVTDKSGQTSDGLTVEVVPWMPAMGHGASVYPTVSALGAGHYVAQPLELSMAGTWQLRIKLTKDAQESHAAIDVDVP